MQSKLLTLSLTLSAFAALSGGDVSAQAFTSPLGLDVIEGNSSHTALFGGIPRRFQQIDGTVIAGGPQTITRIAFRRDGVATTATATSRTFDLEIVMGHGDETNVSPFFEDNYLEPPSTVFATQQVTLPDWSAAPAGAPEAFDFVITLDTPFAYDGVRALVWEMTIENSSSFGIVRIDRQVDAFVSTQSTEVTPGCVVTGGTDPFVNVVDAFNYGPASVIGQRLIFSADNAPNDAPVAMNVCTAATPIPFPGLCASFSPDVLVSLPMGISGPTGEAPPLSLDIPYNPLLDTLPIHTQALALDPGQAGLPVVVSNVQTVLLPPPAVPLACHYIVGSAGTTVGTVFPNRGDVVRFD